MSRTYILTDIVRGKPQWYHLSGLTRSAAIADWLFEYCGWRKESGELPDVIYNYEGEWPCEFMRKHANTVLGLLLYTN